MSSRASLVLVQVSDVSKTVGTLLMFVNFIVGFCLFVWTVANRADTSIRASQPNFLAMVALGAVLSTSTIAALGAEDTVGERGWSSVAAARGGETTTNLTAPETGNAGADMSCMLGVWQVLCVMVYTQPRACGEFCH